MLDENRQPRLQWFRFDNLNVPFDQVPWTAWAADGDGLVTVEYYDGDYHDTQTGETPARGFWIVDGGDRTLLCPSEFTLDQAIAWADDYMARMYPEAYKFLLRH